MRTDRRATWPRSSPMSTSSGSSNTPGRRRSSPGLLDRDGEHALVPRRRSTSSSGCPGLYTHCSKNAPEAPAAHLLHRAHAGRASRRRRARARVRYSSIPRQKSASPSSMRERVQDERRPSRRGGGRTDRAARRSPGRRSAAGSGRAPRRGTPRGRPSGRSRTRRARGASRARRARRTSRSPR